MSHFLKNRYLQSSFFALFMAAASFFSTSANAEEVRPEIRSSQTPIVQVEKSSAQRLTEQVREDGGEMPTVGDEVNATVQNAADDVYGVADKSRAFLKENLGNGLGTVVNTPVDLLTGIGGLATQGSGYVAGFSTDAAIAANNNLFKPIGNFFGSMFSSEEEQNVAPQTPAPTVEQPAPTVEPTPPQAENQEPAPEEPSLGDRIVGGLETTGEAIADATVATGNAIADGTVATGEFIADVGNDIADGATAAWNYMFGSNEAENAAPEATNLPPSSPTAETEQPTIGDNVNAAVQGAADEVYAAGDTSETFLRENLGDGLGTVANAPVKLATGIGGLATQGSGYVAGAATDLGVAFHENVNMPVYDNVLKPVGNAIADGWNAVFGSDENTTPQTPAPTVEQPAPTVEPTPQTQTSAPTVEPPAIVTQQTEEPSLGDRIVGGLETTGEAIADATVATGEFFSDAAVTVNNNVLKPTGDFIVKDIPEGFNTMVDAMTPSKSTLSKLNPLNWFGSKEEKPTEQMQTPQQPTAQTETPAPTTEQPTIGDEVNAAVQGAADNVYGAADTSREFFKENLGNGLGTVVNMPVNLVTGIGGLATQGSGYIAGAATDAGIALHENVGKPVYDNVLKPTGEAIADGAAATGELLKNMGNGIIDGTKDAWEYVFSDDDKKPDEQVQTPNVEAPANVGLEQTPPPVVTFPAPTKAAQEEPGFFEKTGNEIAGFFTKTIPDAAQSVVDFVTPNSNENIEKMSEYLKANGVAPEVIQNASLLLQGKEIEQTAPDKTNLKETLKENSGSTYSLTGKQINETITVNGIMNKDAGR